MKFFKKGELKLLWPFYLDSLISPMLFIISAFMVVYFRDFGLSLFQTSLLFAMIPLFMIIFEIPTGAIADLYGRKFSVLIGTIILGITIISISFLNNFYALLFAFAIIGIGNTFSSGAKEAWITDLIKKDKKDFLLGYFAKSSSMESFGLVFSGIIGALLVKQFGISVIWIVTGISFFVTLLVLGFAKEYFVKRKIKIRGSIKNILKQSATSIRYVKNNSILFLFLIANVIVTFAWNFSGDLSWVPFLQGLNFPDYAFGYLWSAMGVVGIFASLISLKLMKKGKERQFIVSTIILTIIFLLLIIFVKNIIPALLIFLFLTFFVKMSYPAERVYFHKFIKSKFRATIGSVESMFLSIIGIISIPLVGLSVDFLGARYTIFLSALLLIPSVIIYFKIRNKERLAE